MKLKTLEVEVEGKKVLVAAVTDGKPVYTRDDGTEMALDGPHAIEKIKTISEERDGFRTRAETAEAGLKGFEGIDAAKAREALEAVASLTGKKAEDAEAQKRQREEIGQAWQAKLDAQKLESDRALAAKASVIRKLTIGQSFATSKLFDAADPKILMTPAVAEAVFGQNFDTTEDGAVIAYWDPATKQKPIQSRDRPGENASVDEAVMELFSRMPDRERLTPPSGKKGSGLTTTTATSSTGHKTMSREAFSKMTAAEQSEFSLAGGALQ